jgi:hypothetical protein
MLIPDREEIMRLKSELIEARARSKEILEKSRRIVQEHRRIVEHSLPADRSKFQREDEGGARPPVAVTHPAAHY